MEGAMFCAFQALLFPHFPSWALGTIVTFYIAACFPLSRWEMALQFGCQFWLWKFLEFREEFLGRVESEKAWELSMDVMSQSLLFRSLIFSRGNDLHSLENWVQISSSYSCLVPPDYQQNTEIGIGKLLEIWRWNSGKSETSSPMP